MMKRPQGRKEAVRPVLRMAAAGLAIPLLLLAIFAVFNSKAIAQAFSIVTCSTTSTACTGGKNTSSGQGVSGTSASGYGVEARTTNGTAALYAATATSNSTHTAVLGTATNNAFGVQGLSVNNAGVYGYSTNDIAVEGINSSGSAGVYGQGANFGLYASTPNAGVAGIYSLGASADGADIYSDSASAIYAQNGCGGGCSNGYPAIEAVSNEAGEGVDSFTSGQLAGRFENNGSSPQGDGVEMYGQYIGLISRAPSGSGTYPLVLTDTSNNDLFFVDGNGDVFYHGSLNQFSRTRDGNVARSYGTQSTSPGIEDNGTARLSMGTAQVALNPAFARSIEGPYQVMLTPDGDTRGLYVAQKSSGWFTVREMQGGRSSIAFDYHVYATRLGYSNEHMTEMTPAFERAFEPRSAVKTVRPSPRRPIKLKLHK